MKFSGDAFFKLCFERNWDLLPALSCSEDWGGRVYWLLDAICQCTSRALMTHQLQLRGQHRITVKRLLHVSKKNRNDWVSIKRFLKRNLAHIGIVQCMNTLADKVHKQEVPCTQWYAPPWHGHSIQQPSLHKCSGTPVGAKFTATYVGMVVE